MTKQATKERSLPKNHRCVTCGTKYRKKVDLKTHRTRKHKKLSVKPTLVLNKTIPASYGSK